jgi:hypothetical protein
MMQSSGDAGEVAQTNSNMTRLFFEDCSPFVLRHRPPSVGLPDRDQSGSRSGTAVKAFLPRGQLFDPAPRGVYRVLLVDPRRVHAAVEPFIALPLSMTFSLGASARLSPTTGVMRSIRHAPMLPAANETNRGAVAGRCDDCGWASPSEWSGGRTDWFSSTFIAMKGYLTSWCAN